MRRRNPQKLKVLVVGLLPKQFNRLRAPRWVDLRSFESGAAYVVITGFYDVIILNVKFISHKLVTQAKQSALKVLTVSGGVGQVQATIDQVVGEVVRSGR